MSVEINVPEYEIKEEKEYFAGPYEGEKYFPILTIGRNSYVTQAYTDICFDEQYVYNFQIGRYSSLASNINLFFDLNHDYKKVSQGRIAGVDYERPTHISRKGQIIIMNDCWIGKNTTILSGVTIGNGAVVAAESVISKDVPAYSIVAGNPAKVIGYRFTEEEIDKLNLIRWWNWSADKVVDNANLLYGEISAFIDKHLSEAEDNVKNIPNVSINPIKKESHGEEKIFLYIPDFEQDYPTYPRVIRSFIENYSDTNYELLLYIKEDELIDEKISLLYEIFEEYEDNNCYVNIFVENLQDERALFKHADCYITNRSKDNIMHMDMADYFGIPCISGVDKPIFGKENLGHIIKAKNSML